MPIACYVLIRFSAGAYSNCEIQITSFWHFEFCGLVILWDFTLERSPDQIDM